MNWTGFYSSFKSYRTSSGWMASLGAPGTCSKMGKDGMVGILPQKHGEERASEFIRIGAELVLLFPRLRSSDQCLFDFLLIPWLELSCQWNFLIFVIPIFMVFKHSVIERFQVKKFMVWSQFHF